MNKHDWLEVQKLQHCNDYMGVKFPSGTGDDYDYYIAILPDAFQSDKHLLCTIIHEMAHAMDAATETSFQPPHGPRFKKGAKSLMRSLGKVPSAEPTFCKNFQYQWDLERMKSLLLVMFQYCLRHYQRAVVTKR